MIPRYLRRLHSLPYLLTVLGLGAGLVHTASAFVISTAPGLFVPSFRDAGDADGGQSTAFGWGLTGGRFDGDTDDDNIDFPTVTFSPGGLNGTLVQAPANTEGDGGLYDILAGSNNIYASPGGAVLNLGVPVNGATGVGYTTIVIQGRTAFGAYPEAVSSMFGEVAGISPAFAEGLNARGQGQFWAKYDIPGNTGNYTIPMTLPAGSNISIAELKVDTLFSISGFAPDSAVVPEPSGALMILAGGLALAVRRRRAATEQTRVRAVPLKCMGFTAAAAHGATSSRGYIRW